MNNLWNREPVLILAAVQTSIALAIAFGTHLTAEQTGAIMAFTAAILGIITRQRVTPN